MIVDEFATNLPPFIVNESHIISRAVPSVVCTTPAEIRRCLQIRLPPVITNVSVELLRTEPMVSLPWGYKAWPLLPINSRYPLPAIVPPERKSALPVTWRVSIPQSNEPVYPDPKVILATESVISRLQGSTEVASNTTSSDVAGSASVLQLVWVLHLLSAPPPSQVIVAAKEGMVRISRIHTMNTLCLLCKSTKAPKIVRKGKCVIKIHHRILQLYRVLRFFSSK